LFKRFSAVALLALLLAVPAHAEGPMGGLGFRSGSSPFSTLNNLAFLYPVELSPTVGGRHWINDQVGLDLGVGYNQFEIDAGPRKWTGFVFDIGLPISLKRVSDNVNFIFRPGFQWSSLEDKDESVIPTAKLTLTTIAVSGELEVEWMVTDNLSVSASHGVAYHKLEDDFSPKTTITSFGTIGNTFSNLGFHVYLW